MDTQLLPIGDTTLDLPDLRARLDGEVFAPAGAGWDLARARRGTSPSISSPPRWHCPSRPTT